MNVKRYIAASVAVFVGAQVLDFLIHNVMLRSIYEQTKHLWRPDMESKLWIMWVVSLITSFLFVYIFSMGYERKGIMEGFRFGLVIGLFTSLPMGYATYAVMPIPYQLAFKWFLYGTAETIVLGIIAAIVYRPAPKPA